MSLKYLYWTLKKNTHLDSFFRNFRSSCFELLFWFSSTILLSKMKYFFSTWENLSNSSCHFWKLKSVFLQILNQYSVPSNITPLYFFCSKIIYFGQKQPIKSANFSNFRVKIRKNSWCQFWSDKPIPLQIFHHSSVWLHNSSVLF